MARTLLATGIRAALAETYSAGWDEAATHFRPEVLSWLAWRARING